MRALLLWAELQLESACLLDSARSRCHFAWRAQCCSHRQRHAAGHAWRTSQDHSWQSACRFWSSVWHMFASNPRVASLQYLSRPSIVVTDQRGCKCDRSELVLTCHYAGCLLRCSDQYFWCGLRKARPRVWSQAWPVSTHGGICYQGLYARYCHLSRATGSLLAARPRSYARKRIASSIEKTAPKLQRIRFCSGLPRVRGRFCRGSPGRRLPP